MDRQILYGAAGADVVKERIEQKVILIFKNFLYCRGDFGLPCRYKNTCRL